jgi:cellulose synthase/poly-beta-1,6-N-acetylglucosamine synthase-like glycosyltransferase
MSFFLIVLVLIILYTYFGYFFGVVLLGLLFKKDVLKKDIEPEVNLLIAAFNEEKGIAKKIENSLRLDYPKNKLKIIVVSDGSTDRTDEIVQSYAHLGVELIRVEGRVGKTEARNVAMK